MFEEDLEELASELMDGRVEVVESFEDAPDREPNEYHWFSVLDGAGAEGLTEEDVTESYTAAEVPDRQGVIVLAIWERPMNNAFYIHGTVGETVNDEFGLK